MATKPAQEDRTGGDLTVGNDLEDFGPHAAVEVRKTADGRAALLPVNPRGRRLNADGLDYVADIQATVRQLRTLNDQLDELIAEARENCGVPWALIGFSVGLSGDRARIRWGTT